MATYADLTELCRKALNKCEKGDVGSEAYAKEVIRQVGVFVLGGKLRWDGLGFELGEGYAELVGECENSVREMVSSGTDICLNASDIRYFSDLLRRSVANAPCCLVRKGYNCLMRKGYKIGSVGYFVHRAREDLLAAASKPDVGVKAERPQESKML